MVGGGAISWTSKLQPTVALSTAEAEYITACAATQEAVYLRQLVKDMGFKQKGATVIYDNHSSSLLLEAHILDQLPQIHSLLSSCTCRHVLSLSS